MARIDKYSRGRNGKATTKTLMDNLNPCSVCLEHVLFIFTIQLAKYDRLIFKINEPHFSMLLSFGSIEVTPFYR